VQSPDCVDVHGRHTTGHAAAEVYLLASGNRYGPSIS
jgi:hypothetical protein